MQNEKIRYLINMLETGVFIRIENKDIRNILEFFDKKGKKYIVVNMVDHYILKLWNVPPDC